MVNRIVTWSVSDCSGREILECPSSILDDVPASPPTLKSKHLYRSMFLVHTHQGIFSVTCSGYYCFSTDIWLFCNKSDCEQCEGPYAVCAVSNVKGLSHCCLDWLTK